MEKLYKEIRTSEGEWGRSVILDKESGPDFENYDPELDGTNLSPFSRHKQISLGATTLTSLIMTLNISWDGTLKVYKKVPALQPHHVATHQPAILCETFCLESGLILTGKAGYKFITADRVQLETRFFPFQLHFWAFLCLLVLITGFYLILLQKSSGKTRRESWRKYIYPLLQTFYWIYGILIEQSGNKEVPLAVSSSSDDLERKRQRMRIWRMIFGLWILSSVVLRNGE